MFARVDAATAAALRVEMDALSGASVYVGARAYRRGTDGAVAGLDGWRAPTASLDDLALRDAPSLTAQLLARPSALAPAEDAERLEHLEVAQVAREIVANLRSAGTRHRLLVDHVAKRVAVDDSALDDYRRRANASASLGGLGLGLGLSSLQFVAGLLVGVCMGVTLARLAAPATVRQQSLVSKLSKWCSDRARVGRYYASPHVLPFPLDDLSYFVHPPAVEVA